MKCLNKRLLLIFVLQLALVAVAWWPRSSKTLPQQPLFQSLKTSEIATITIEDGKEKVILRRLDGKWVLPQAAEYPADQKKVDELVKKVETIKPGLAVGQSAASHRRLEVSEERFQRKVSFSKDEGKDEAGFYLGSAPQFRQVHIRPLGNDEVFATDKVAAQDLPVASAAWLDHALVNVKSDDIVAIEVKRDAETLHFQRQEEKDKDGKVIGSIWQLDGKPVNKAKFDAVLRNLTELRMQEVMGKESKPDYGFETPAGRIDLTVKTAPTNQAATAGETKIVSFVVGKRQQLDYILQLAGSPFYVKVAGYQLAPLLETKRKEFTSAS